MKRIVTQTGHIEIYENDDDEQPKSGGKLLYPGYNQPEREFPKQERENKSGSGGILLPILIKEEDK